MGLAHDGVPTERRPCKTPSVTDSLGFFVRWAAARDRTVALPAAGPPAQTPDVGYTRAFERPSLECAPSRAGSLLAEPLPNEGPTIFPPLEVSPGSSPCITGS